MSVETVFQTAAKAVQFTLDPAAAGKELHTLWESVMAGGPEEQGVTLASTLATAGGLIQNGLYVPAQGALSAGVNFFAIRYLLRSFVAPETNSAKDLIVHLISLIGSGAIGYQVAESMGYASLPHCNPDYDSRFISIGAAGAGSTAAAIYCLWLQHQAQKKADAEAATTWGTLNHYFQEGKNAVNQWSYWK